MKKLLIIVFAVAFAVNAQAQFKFGVKGGLTTTDVKVNDLLVTNAEGAQQLKLAVQDADYGVHAGIFFRIGEKIFLQPEFLYNSSEITYRLEDLNLGAANDLITEKTKYLDIPVNAGLKFGFLRIQGGPVGHILLENTSGLLDLDGYKEDFKNFTLGWQAGIGLDIAFVNLDLRWQGNFNKFGDHINFFGNDLDFDKRPGRTVLSVGVLF